MSVTLNCRESVSGGRQGDVGLKDWKFPGGEVGVKIDFSRIPEFFFETLFTITWNYQGDHEMMVVAQMVDAIRRNKSSNKIELKLPYLPYARQDRVCEEGESHALKVFANWLNGLQFEVVHILDPHSYVAEAVVDRMAVIPQEAGFRKFLASKLFIPGERQGYDYLIAPDAGAAKKVQQCRAVQEACFGYAPEVIVANKIRKGGEVIVQLDCGGLEGKKICVVDDICDGGATFISLGKHIRSKCEPETLDLFVSHGIFSNLDNTIIMAGCERHGVVGLFDKIHTTNLMNKKVTNYVTAL